MNPEKPEELYLVVINDEEQYSLWPAYRDVPQGWRSVGEPGTREAGLAYIQKAWTDMRPLSLRQAMQAAGQG